jgi:DNA helicase IV
LPAIAEVVAELLGRHASVAVIDGTDSISLQEDERVTVVTGPEAKGLEFDAVVVVEPGCFTALGPRGFRLLYIALTRAVQELVVVHTDPLPDVLGELSTSNG